MRAINAKRFSAIMRKLARVPSRSSAAIASAIGEEVQSRMDASEDPYRRKWKLKADRSKSILKKSGDGRASIIAKATSGAGIAITVGVLYMIYHQFGGKSHLRGHKKHPDFGRDKDRSSKKRNRPPKRSFLPFDRMPQAWVKIFEEHLTKASMKVLRG